MEYIYFMIGLDKQNVDLKASHTAQEKVWPVLTPAPYFKSSYSLTSCPVALAEMSHATRKQLDNFQHFHI